MEGREPDVASLEEERTRPIGVVVPDRRELPRRRRRSALLGGAILVAISPVAVGAGRFVLGYVALGVGASLLLLPPPKENRPGRLRSTRSIVGRPVAASGRGTVALARGSAGLGARALSAAARFAATQGRDGATAVGRTANAAGSHAWAATRAQTS